MPARSSAGSSNADGLVNYDGGAQARLDRSQLFLQVFARIPCRVCPAFGLVPRAPVLVQSHGEAMKLLRPISPPACATGVLLFALAGALAAQCNDPIPPPGGFALTTLFSQNVTYADGLHEADK